jgi:biopolymer transport protein ExbB
MTDFTESRAAGRMPMWLVLILFIVLFALSSVFLLGVKTEVAEMFHEGGWGMWPILAILVFSVLMAVDSAVYLSRSSTNASAFMSNFNGLIQSGNVAGAIQLCQAHNKPLSRIIAAGLLRAGDGEHWVNRNMDETAFSELPKIEVRTGYLALLGNVATLSGLLGTIVGLIKSFAGVSKEQTGDKATMLAAGISEAMNCTAFGLMTGIIALLAFSVLNGATQSLLDEINHQTLRAFRFWKKTQLTGNEPFEHRPIAAPGPHLKHHVGLGRGGSGGHGRKSTFASLQLTPMIDMFIVVLIFLLMTFQAEGQILSVSRDIKLPFAEKVDKLARAPIIAISYPENDPAGGVVTLDGSEVSTARELVDDDSPDWKIAKLAEQLEVKKHNWKMTNPDKQFPGEVIIQSDQNVDFKIIKKVMYSVGLAGYPNVHFAVSQKVGEVVDE